MNSSLDFMHLRFCFHSVFPKSDILHLQSTYVVMRACCIHRINCSFFIPCITCSSCWIKYFFSCYQEGLVFWSHYSQSFILKSHVGFGQYIRWNFKPFLLPWCLGKWHFFFGKPWLKDLIFARFLLIPYNLFSSMLILLISRKTVNSTVIL